MNAKIWNTTRTGFKVHAFIDGNAQCRSSIKEGPASAHSHSAARRWVLGTPGLSFCPACEHYAYVAEQTLNAAHAEALAMNAEFDAKAAPACTCTNHTGFQKHGYHLATCPTITDTEENNDVTIKEGPLTERQLRITGALREGKRHEEIARDLSTPDEITSLNVIKMESQNITSKFGATTMAQAVSLWATAQAYREAADLLEAGKVDNPYDKTEEHMNHVLDGLAQILRERADRITPQ